MSEQLESYLTGLGLRLTAIEDHNDKAQGWQSNTRHFRVTLSREGRRMSFWFYQGSGIKEDPDLSAVIYCLACDRSYANDTFEEFIANCGYDEDSVRTYRTIVDLNKRFERVIGSDTLLDEITEKVLDN